VPGIQIVTPTLRDSGVMASVLYEASAAAYAGIFPPGALWTLEQTEASCRGHLSDPQAVVLAAVSGDDAARQWLGVGVALLSADRPGQMELRRLYVRPACWSQGVGGGLHDEILRRAQERGAMTAELSVLERNDRARRFDEHRGWRLIPDAGVDAHDGVTEVRYCLDIH
jgi:GNAT superfamily N-acetyltransferase